ncbi:MAG: NAD(+) synthase [Lachnospiraceae bacterium]|nr:NAD(+) synthase [Lachnospiraceae bacterium]
MDRLSDGIIEWIRNYYSFSPDAKAIIGISGGTDSSVTAALLVRALGKERVIGVLMPCGDQHDIDVSRSLVKSLGIKYHVINIKDTVNAVTKEIGDALSTDPMLVDAYKTNTPARIRMTTLYGICAIYGGRVANTCNLSEDYIGYSTKFGDAAGDFSVLSGFTKTEVRQIGRELNLDNIFVDKIPEDGMSGKSDEERMGFTYAVLDRYIRSGEIDDPEVKALIDKKHAANLHKLRPMPAYDPGLPISAC